MGITICNGKRVEGYDPNSGSNSEAAVAAHNAECHERTYEGAVLRLRERNGYDDSDFYALVWDEEQQRVREIQYATTRGWTYHNGASIDATHEVIAKAVAQMTEARFALVQEDYAQTPRKEYTARATVKGAAVEGVIAWVGKSRNRYIDIARYGIKVEGRKGYVFRDATDDDFEFDVPPVSEADMITWRSNCEHNVRAELAQAQAIADQRDPRPAAPAPGTIVDAQEEDETGMRLYAVGESFCEDGWAQQVAAAVVDESAAEYTVMGHRADGSKMPAREVTVFRALGMVARWVENDGAQVCHDGRGVVRIVREDGARLMLAPVRPQEAAQGPQEDAERPGVAEETQEAPTGAETAEGGAQEAQGAEERHDMVSGLPMGQMACLCGLTDVDALLGHWVATGVLPVVPLVEMSGVWRITGRGAEVYAEGATQAEAWADAARQGFERDYFHAITHLSMAELEALTAPQEAAVEGERVA
ncbi:hypothetical protein FNV58_01050 (plasmid) [Streptomyces sp. RLB1-9]|uniref:hypothetical protein n=1 Tax=Streptomyces sp. RLB1-9 TaxID=2594454 RepID=UPI00116216D1|nr:hypothetical protein [Streptomyces sp. RLB1-9]QDN94948.1 hypothetical protein FNV58_01050 [Streptomyces sp. RLB1-9]